MTIDIDAIRERADRYKQTAVGSGKTIQAIQLANNDIPALLAELDKARSTTETVRAELERRVRQVADLADKLHKANADNASHTKAGTAWANEVAAKDKVIEAVESLLMVTDGDPLGDHGIAIPLGEIRRVLGEARAEVAR